MPRGGSRENAGRRKKYGENVNKKNLPISFIEEIEKYTEEYADLRKSISRNKSLSPSQIEEELEKLGSLWDWFCENLYRDSIQKEEDSLIDLTGYRKYKIYSSSVSATPGASSFEDSVAEDGLFEEVSLENLLVDKPEKTFLLSVVGNSMTDIGMQDGTLLLVEEYRPGESKVENGQVVVVSLGSDGRMVKVFYKESDDKILLLSANRNFEPIVLDADSQIELRIQGIVKRFFPPTLGRVDVSQYLDMCQLLL